MSVLTDRITRREIESAPEPILAEVLDFVLFVKARNASAEASPVIRRTPGVCGGEACIRMTRIAVWMLEEARRSGVSDADLLSDYPDLNEDDLAAAWQYVGVQATDNQRARSADALADDEAPARGLAGKTLSGADAGARRIHAGAWEPRA